MASVDAHRNDRGVVGDLLQRGLVPMSRLQTAIRALNALTLADLRELSPDAADRFVSMHRVLLGDPKPGNPQVKPPERPDHIDPSVWAMMLAGSKIRAIKAYRECTDASLTIAKTFVEDNWAYLKGYVAP